MAMNCSDTITSVRMWLHDGSSTSLEFYTNRPVSSTAFDHVHPYVWFDLVESAPEFESANQIYPGPGPGCDDQ